MKFFPLLSFLFMFVACEYPVDTPKSDFNRIMNDLHALENKQNQQGGDPDLREGEKAFQSTCSSCHGPDGKAATAAAAAMNPKPKNLTDRTWQDSKDDDHIVKVITNGGASVGLSPTMPAWGAVLGGEQVVKVVKYIRSLKAN